MEANELTDQLALLLDIDIPIHTREHFFKDLYCDLLHENRVRAEARGIGKASQLSHKTLYSVKECVESDELLRRRGDWAFHYHSSLHQFLIAQAQRERRDTSTGYEH